jgi:hypothetical protein
VIVAGEGGLAEGSHAWSQARKLFDGDFEGLTKSEAAFRLAGLDQFGKMDQKYAILMDFTGLGKAFDGLLNDLDAGAAKNGRKAFDGRVAAATLIIGALAKTPQQPQQYSVYFEVRLTGRGQLGLSRAQHNTMGPFPFWGHAAEA